jgi:hypothetical protein
MCLRTPCSPLGFWPGCGFSDDILVQPSFFGGGGEIGRCLISFGFGLPVCPARDVSEPLLGSRGGSCGGSCGRGLSFPDIDFLTMFSGAAGAKLGDCPTYRWASHLLRTLGHCRAEHLGSVGGRVRCSYQLLHLSRGLGGAGDTGRIGLGLLGRTVTPRSPPGVAGLVVMGLLSGLCVMFCLHLLTGLHKLDLFNFRRWNQHTISLSQRNNRIVFR